MTGTEQMPASVECERFVLGTALAFSDRMTELRGSLHVDDFAIEQHRVIWRAACKLFDAGKHTDRVTVIESLQHAGKLDGAGGFTYLIGLEEGMPRTASVDGYVQTVRDKAFLRNVARAASSLEKRCLLQADTPAEVAAYAHGLLATLQPPDAKSEFCTLAEATERLGMDRILHPKRGVDTIPLPLPWLDDKTGGLAPEQLVIVGGRTSQGKTSLATMIALGAAERGFRTVIFSLEMNVEDMFRKMVAQSAQIDEWRIRDNRISQQEREQVHRHYGAVMEMPLHVMDTDARSVSQVAAALRRLRTQKGAIGLVIVDHLHALAASGSPESRTQQIGADARMLKLLAREFRCPFVVPAQLNNATARDNQKPTLSDLRQSGEIAENADMVLFCWLDTADKSPVQKGSILIGKQRRGVRDIAKEMQFHRATQVWGELHGDD